MHRLEILTFAIVTFAVPSPLYGNSIASFIFLSNSSMHTTPRSASTMAPCLQFALACILICRDGGCETNSKEPLPVVLTAYAATPEEKHLDQSCDFATDGSPTIRQLISPRMWVPFFRFFSLPPSNRRTRARLILSWPQIEGANDSKQSEQSLWIEFRGS